MSAFNDVLNKKAVALSYDENSKAAPVIVASGMGYVAEKIIETASEHGVPVYEDNSLATVLTQLELGAEIPQELYQAIVEIYVYFLNYAPGIPNVQQEEEVSDESVQQEEAEDAVITEKTDAI